MNKLINMPKVGDIVHWSDINNRRGELSKGTVTKVGSKLLTVGRRVFRLDTMSTNDEYQHQTLILDLQAYNDKQKKFLLSRLIKDRLNKNDVELSALEAIGDLLGITV